jgi:hypothetical protein
MGESNKQRKKGEKIMNTWIESKFRRMKIGELFSEKDYPQSKLETALKVLQRLGCVRNLQKDIWEKVSNPPTDYPSR